MLVSDHVLLLVTFLATLSCGLIAGLFFIFSNTVMKALARITPACGIAAMQSINVVIVNPLFLVAFLGSAITCLFLLVLALIRLPDPGTPTLIAGSGVYLIGSFGVTMAFNVPRNNTLARLDSCDSQATAAWRNYLTTWTRWNHIRTIASLASAALLMHALCQLYAHNV